MTATSPALPVNRVAASRLSGIELCNVSFSSVFSDHMLVADFYDGAWRESSIHPYGPLTLPPCVTALQYGISVFEGLKSRRTVRGDIATFRPWDNARRLNRSAARLAMPEVPEELFLTGLRELLRLDRAWVPPCDHGALYIRPVFFSVDESLRVKPADRYRFVIFTCPFSAYYAAAVDVLVSERYVRAFPGGTGDVKPAGNYAPALLAEREAQKAGFQTVMWLDGIERSYVEECGVMNVFFVIGDEIVTPSISGTILAGITRDSVVVLLREMGWRVAERQISIHEVVEAHDSGRLRECFGTGTAATLCPIGRIRYRDRDLLLPDVEQQAIGSAVRERLVGIATGRVRDTHGWLDLL
jgi:branched-chain amino acid aminotransferase